MKVTCDMTFELVSRNMIQVYLFLVLSAAVAHAARKRCRKACEREVSELKERVSVLEEKLSRLESKADYRGKTISSGDILLNLPSCRAGEFITSDGRHMYCFAPSTSEANVKITKGRRADINPPGVQKVSSQKMKRFMKKYMIQSLFADTWDLHSFNFKSGTFLGMSRLTLQSSQSFTLYKLFRGSFLQKSTLWIPNTRRWTSYEWHDEMYIIIACNDNADQNEQAYSYVYKVVNDQLHEFQKLPTKRAFGVTAIDADGHFYVIFAYMYGIASDVFRFESTRFVKHSSIPVIGSDIQSFKIGKTVYLAVVGTTTNEKAVYLLKYHNDDFRPYINIDVEDRGSGIKHIQVGNQHFLAVARIDKASSLLLKWNGMTFEPFQLLDSCKARDFATLRMMIGSREMTYIAVINFDCKPVVYVYDVDERKEFVKLQETDSMWTRDMEFIPTADGQEVYLAVSTKRMTSIYAGST